MHISVKDPSHTVSEAFKERSACLHIVLFICLMRSAIQKYWYYTVY